MTIQCRVLWSPFSRDMAIPASQHSHPMEHLLQPVSQHSISVPSAHSFCQDSLWCWTFSGFWVWWRIRHYGVTQNQASSRRSSALCPAQAPAATRPFVISTLLLSPEWHQAHVHSPHKAWWFWRLTLMNKAAISIRAKVLCECSVSAPLGQR